jgi:hypothetical protein
LHTQNIYSIETIPLEIKNHPNPNRIKAQGAIAKKPKAAVRRDAPCEEL